MDDCKGLYGSLNEAVAELNTPRIKEVKPMVTYKGFLSLSDAEQYQSSMEIDVERYPRTMIKAPPSASSYVLKTEGATYDAQAAHMSGHDQAGNDDALASVKNMRAYQVKDEAAPGGKRDVERADLEKGYEYGATVVPVSDSDATVFNMETKAAYEIVGFIPVESVSMLCIDRGLADTSSIPLS